MTLSRLIHVSTNDPVSFLFMTEAYSTGYLHHIFFIHSSTDGHLGCFHVLMTVLINSAAVNTAGHVSFGMMVFFQVWAQEGTCWMI